MLCVHPDLICLLIIILQGGLLAEIGDGGDHFWQPKNQSGGTDFGGGGQNFTNH